MPAYCGHIFFCFICPKRFDHWHFSPKLFDQKTLPRQTTRARFLFFPCWDSCPLCWPSLRAMASLSWRKSLRFIRPPLHWSWELWCALDDLFPSWWSWWLLRGFVDCKVWCLDNSRAGLFFVFFFCDEVATFLWRPQESKTGYLVMLMEIPFLVGKMQVINTQNGRFFDG